MNEYHPLAKPEKKLSKYGLGLTIPYLALIIFLFFLSKGCDSQTCTFFGIIMTVLALPISLLAWLFEMKYDYLLIFLGMAVNIIFLYKLGVRWEKKLRSSERFN